MAVTKIHPIKSTLKKALDYIAIVIYSFLAFKANARNNKNAAASSLN